MTKKHPRVSILIPTYDRKDMTVEAIASALSQTMDDLEVVVVDNASDDGTWDACQHYAQIDSRVRVFRNKENVGPVRNWQRCFAEARGEFGKILFSDDLMEPRYLECTLPLIQHQKDVGFVFTAARIGNKPGLGDVNYAWEKYAPIVSSRTFMHFSLFDSVHVPVSPGAALFRMKDLRDHLVLSIPSPTIHDFADHGAGPDALLYYLTAIKYPFIAHVSDPLMFFRAHPGSISVRMQGGYLEARYIQAFIWFAWKYLDRAALKRVLESFRRTHSFEEDLSLEEFATRYLEQPPVFS